MGSREPPPGQGGRKTIVAVLPADSIAGMKAFRIVCRYLERAPGSRRLVERRNPAGRRELRLQCPPGRIRRPLSVGGQVNRAAKKLARTVLVNMPYPQDATYALKRGLRNRLGMLAEGGVLTIKRHEPVLLIEHPDERVVGYLGELGYRPFAFAGGRFVSGSLGELNTYFLTREKEALVKDHVHTMLEVD